MLAVETVSHSVALLSQTRLVSVSLALSVHLLVGFEQVSATPVQLSLPAWLLPRAMKEVEFAVAEMFLALVNVL